jgi:hypothetical protein
MDFITTNKQKILAWYVKQLEKEDIHLPDVNNEGGWLDIPNPIILKLVERQLGKAVLINVKPLLQRNMCHFNVWKMLQVLNQKTKRYKGVFGVNVTGCPCGKLYGIEIHSVLKCDDEYIDLTKDFAGATKKYFIPLKEWDKEDWDEIWNLVHDFKICGQDSVNFGVSHSCRLPKGMITWGETQLGDWKLIKELIKKGVCV